MTRPKPVAPSQNRPRVFGFSGSFFFNKNLRGLLKAAGLAPEFGWPHAGDFVLVWGRGKTAQRGLRIARMTGAQVITVEDGFLRSVQTGREGEASHGVIVDHQGIYFETGKPNDLKVLLAAAQDMSGADLQQASKALALLRQRRLSKYNDFPEAAVSLPERFVLVVDQTFLDASISGANAHAGSFQEMLDAALAEHPDCTILIKTHPETIANRRRGYFDGHDQGGRVQLFVEKISPWYLLEQAEAVYCVSSQLGMEAIFAGHKPVVFGDAFYCGFGLTDDRNARTRADFTLTAEQLFAAVYLKYCCWVDPLLGEKTDFETVVNNISARKKWVSQRRMPVVFAGMRLWKRGFLRRFFTGESGAPQFVDTHAKAVETAKRKRAELLVWAGKETPDLSAACEAAGVALVRVEDGFLRSSGLGAQLIEPVSLALDDLGIYYDPSRPSRMEALIEASEKLGASDLARAQRLRERMIDLGVTKYNLDETTILNIPEGQHSVLVPGQVEDDQSILTGADAIKTNLDLVAQTRAKFPQSYLIYKPHPDVMAGLRDGGAALVEIETLVDCVLFEGNMAHVLEQVDTVSTMTSLTGFEALLRGKKVLCFGAPFYAGWGLTEDVGAVPGRRTARPTLDGLVHAALIDYPSYWDPVTGQPCTPETVVERFARGMFQRSGRPSIRLLAKAQGLLASYAHLWR